MNGQTAASLSDLLHADRKLVELYETAFEKVSAEFREQLSGIVEDHRRHEMGLAEACSQAEMQVGEADEDVIDLLDEHHALLRTARDEATVLETLQLAERATSILYGHAEREDLPEEIADLIVASHADERLHVSMIAEQTPRPHSGGTDHDLACLTGGITDDKNPDDFD